MANQAAQCFLKSVPESQLRSLVGDEVFYVESTDTAKAVISKFAEKRFHCAPVRDPATDSYTGLLDLCDVLQHIVQNHKPSATKSHSLAQVLAESMHISKIPVSNFSGKYNFTPLPAESSLYDCCLALSQGSRRVPIQDASGKLVNFIAPSAIATYLASNLDKVGDLANMKLSELGIIKADILTVTKDSPTLDAFKTMVEKNVSALAVVGSDGSFLANLSSSDVKVFASRNFSLLHLPVLQFLSEVKANDLKTKSLTITCKQDALFSDIVREIAATKIHRMYVVDENNHLQGLVSVTDIAKFLIVPTQ